MLLSVAAGLVMLIIKFAAYAWTGSTAILSDAAESIVHIIAVIFAAYSLWLSFKPADDQHPYGHAKISFFSAGTEGALIVIAAIYIIYTAVIDWISGPEIHNLDLGVGLTALAAVINAALGYYLVRIGKEKKSIVLEANGKHVLADCWTSAGVVIGLILAMITGWEFLDPLCAIVVAFNILISGFKLVKEGIGGLMDTADPEVQQQILEILDRACKEHNISHHHLRHRFNGHAYDVDVHLVFPDEMPIVEAHRIATEIEDTIEYDLQPGAHVTSHLEPHEDHENVHPDPLK